RVESVITGIGPRDRNTAHIHGFAAGRVLIGKGRRGVARGQQVADDAIVRKDHRGGGRSVVNLVDTRGDYGQHPRRDYTRAGVVETDGVIGAAVAVVDRAARDERLAGADALVVE